MSPLLMTVPEFGAPANSKFAFALALETVVSTHDKIHAERQVLEVEHLHTALDAAQLHTVLYNAAFFIAAK